MLGHLKGFSRRDSQPRELNALGRGVSRKSDRMIWHSERIALSLKFSSKSFWDFESWNLSLEGREEKKKKKKKKKKNHDE